MINRAQIKAQARANFTANYWPAIGISLTFSVLMVVVAYTFIGWPAIPAIMVANAFFYIATYFGDKKSATLTNTLNLGFTNFGRNLGSILLMELMIFGWSLLLIVPGIIKSYEYAMTSYILADCPDVKTVDAITLSRKMMKGHKWEYFVFQLSFIGWHLLSAIVFGLLDIFYTTPYQYTSQAGYYAELKRLVIEQGIVSADEFTGAPVFYEAQVQDVDTVVSPVVTQTSTKTPDFVADETPVATQETKESAEPEIKVEESEVTSDSYDDIAFETNDDTAD